MKKILAIILASLMLLTFVACDSNEETTTEAPEITTEAENVTTEAPAPTEEELAAAASVEAIAKALINKYAEFTGLEQTYNEMMAEMPEEEKISYEEFCSSRPPCPMGCSMPLSHPQFRDLALLRA